MVIFFLVVTACGGNDKQRPGLSEQPVPKEQIENDDSEADPRHELEAARSLWEAQGIHSYSIDVRKTNPLLVSPEVRLHVLDGVPRDVDLVPFGESLPTGISKQPEFTFRDSVYATRYTVAKLLALVDSSIVRGTLKRARYDTTHGYPTSIFLDPRPDAIDDEQVIVVRGLRVVIEE